MKHKLPLTLSRAYMSRLEFALRISHASWINVTKTMKKQYPNDTYSSRQVKYMQRSLSKVSESTSQNTKDIDLTVVFTPREMEASMKAIESELTRLNSSLGVLEFLKQNKLDNKHPHYPGYTVKKLESTKIIVNNIERELHAAWDRGW